MFGKKILFTALFLLIPILAACSPTANQPPATLVAVANDTSLLTHAELDGVKTLQERPFGTGQIALYTWENEQGATCFVAAYLTTINGQWQTHDTAATDCQPANQLIAAHTGNSDIDAPFGPPRHTMVYGHSPLGTAVRIVWGDGMVSHVPLQDGAFLEARDGKWPVERIELLDASNNIIQLEDWQNDETA